MAEMIANANANALALPMNECPVRIQNGRYFAAPDGRTIILGFRSTNFELISESVEIGID